MKPRLIVIFIVANFMALFAGTISFYTIYSNNKSDGFGSGSVLVDHCEEVDWSWRIYRCYGQYRSGAGMSWYENVNVRVRGEYKAGEVIADVNPLSLTGAAQNERYITGWERASVVHNIPWLLLLIASILTPIGTISYAAMRSRKSKRENRKPKD